MRTVKTSSGATAVQVVWSSRRGTREIEHLGSAHDEAELQALKAAALGPFGLGGVEPAGDADRAVGHDAPFHLAGRLLGADQDHPERPAAFGDIQQELLDRAVPLARRVLVQLVQQARSPRTITESGRTAERSRRSRALTLPATALPATHDPRVESSPSSASSSV